MEETADLVSERRGQAFGGRSIGRRETLRAAAAAAVLGLRLLSSQGDSHSSRRDTCHFVFAPALRRPRQKRDIIAAEIGSIFRRKRSPLPSLFIETSPRSVPTAPLLRKANFSVAASRRPYGGINPEMSSRVTNKQRLPSSSLLSSLFLSTVRQCDECRPTPMSVSPLPDLDASHSLTV